MPGAAWFTIKLDTTAPVVTWGPVTNAVASEEMTVLYLVDEPGIVSAQLKLADNRLLDCVVASDRITVQLPDDAPEGIGTLTALARDDVGNESTWTLDIPISGQIPVEVVIPVLPQLPVEEPWRTRTRIVTYSRWTIRTRTRLPSRATIRVRTRTLRLGTVRTPLSVVPMLSTFRVRAHAAANSGLQSKDTWTISKTLEGPETEAEVVALLLL